MARHAGNPETDRAGLIAAAFLAFSLVLGGGGSPAPLPEIALQVAAALSAVAAMFWAPATVMRVKSLMVPPGIPDWYTRRRIVDAGTVAVHGRAWSGGGVDISKVEFACDGVWQVANLEPASASRYAWRGWTAHWDAAPGEHVLQCRATDANGVVQPAVAPWDVGGFGNNAPHKVEVTVR